MEKYVDTCRLIFVFQFHITIFEIKTILHSVAKEESLTLRNEFPNEKAILML